MQVDIGSNDGVSGARSVEVSVQLLEHARAPGAEMATQS
jgi:hypothetical protein